MKYVIIILLVLLAIPAVRYVYLTVRAHEFPPHWKWRRETRAQRQLKARLMEYEHLRSDDLDVQCQHSTALREGRLPRPPIKKPKVPPKPKPLPRPEIESMLDQIKLIDIE
jgi:hypothetical protein